MEKGGVGRLRLMIECMKIDKSPHNRWNGYLRISYGYGVYGWMARLYCHN